MKGKGDSSTRFRPVPVQGSGSVRPRTGLRSVRSARGGDPGVNPPGVKPGKAS